MKILILRNRQRTQKIDLHFLRKIVRTLLQELLDQNNYELGLHLVGAEEMACVNETFLQHTGSTDVITFDHGQNRSSRREEAHSLASSSSSFSSSKTQRKSEDEDEQSLHGELFISVDDAVAQAKQFRTTWPSELVRYIVHGTLHLRGYDDVNPVARRKMKREENRLLKELSRLFPLTKLHGKKP